MQNLPLLLLPGTLCDATLFEYQLKHLTDVATPQVVDIHLQDTLNDVADYVLSQVEGQFAVAGLSYGGVVAFELWRKAPERIAKLALLNTNPYAASKQVYDAQKHFLEMSDRDIRDVAAEFLSGVALHSDKQKNALLCNRVIDMSATIGVHGFINELKAQLARPDSMADLPSITCPTLILTGREDKIVPLSVHEAVVDKIPDARLVALDDCGHLTALEKPDLTTKALRDWLIGDGIWR